ncbi:hypothetical protein N0V86_008468 [Didymella sp. IMI 355093]|nr:hypothetical protein N0V86_008468 [Didymella sp. IMI 355093]
MRDFGLELQEIEHAEDLQPSEYDGADETAPSSLSSGFAFSELDTFSPTEYRDTYHENLQYSANEEHPEAFSDDPMFDMDVLYEGSEEELTEDDDVDEEEMEDIDDIEGIVDNLVQVCQQRATDEDVCYMTNFAPNMLRAWSESLP